MDIATALFYLVAIITVGSAAVVAFSRNIIYSAFSLMGTFAGVAGIYVFLGADFGPYSLCRDVDASDHGR